MIDYRRTKMYYSFLALSEHADFSHTINFYYFIRNLLICKCKWFVTVPIQLMHKSHIDKYTSLTKRKRTADSSACSSPAPKQLRLDQCGQRTSVTQQTVDRLVMDVIVEGLLPFSFVSLPSVKALVTGMYIKSDLCRNLDNTILSNFVCRLLGCITFLYVY